MKKGGSPTLKSKGKEITGASDLKKKNIVCKDYKTGTCKFGDKCHFLHSDAPKQ